MIEKKTVIDQIEINRAGVVQIRFGLLLVEDGVEIDCKWHRTSVPPGTSLEAQIRAVDDHLQQIGKAPIETDRISELQAITDIVQTPKRVADFKEAARARDESFSSDEPAATPVASNN